MARSIFGILMASLAFAPLTLGINAQGTHDDEMAKCRMAMKFWPKIHLDGLAHLTQSDVK